MNAQAIVGALYGLGASLTLEQGELLIDAPDGALDDALIARIRQHKQEIVALVRAFETSAVRPADRPALRRAPAYDCAASLAQQRMLFMEELAGNQSYYNMPVAFDIAGPLNRAALVSAFDQLLASHDVLRSHFLIQDQVYVQRVCAPSALAIGDVDLSAEGDQQGALQSLLAQEAEHRFDLQAEWPIRVSLIALARERHVLSINIHHIAADGWSARRIVDDIGAAYAARLSGIAHAVLPRRPQYADYVAWQNAWLGSEHDRQARRYWTETLKGAPELHSMPTDFVRPSVQVIAGDTYAHAMTPALSAAVGAAARAFRTTPFVILQCGFAALLGRYSGQSDLVFGTAAANRQPLEFVDTVGLFVNTLALRYTLADDMSFADLVEQGKDVSAGAFRHQQLPFDALVEVLQPRRSLGYNPIVQIMLVMQESEAAALQLQGAHVVQRAQRQPVSKFDLALHVHAGPGGFQCKWEFNTSLFRRETIQAMSDHFQHLLGAFLDQPQCSIDSVPMVAAAAADDALAADHPAPRCIHRLFEAQAAARPDAVAVIDGARRISYEALDQRANRLAGRLHRAGLGPAARIGVYMEKSVDLVVAMLAIYKVGAVYVPLDPHYPAERIAFMIDDAGMALLLTGAGGTLPPGATTTVATLDVTALADAHDAPAPVAVDASAPAYIIYTSGSTGKPKGVLVTQANLFHSLCANRAVMGIDGNDIMPTIGSQAFGASLLEILLPLISGGAVQIVTKAEVADVERLLERTAGVTVMHAVPSLMRQWLDAVIAADGAASYPHLRLLLVGGEAVPANLLKRIQAWRPSVRLIALYGMTEAAIVCSSFEPDGATAAHYCIGKPYPSSRFYVLNRHGQRQPAGVPGELHIGGLAIAAGYVNQPEMTDERFIRSALPGAGRLYKTGDRARLLSDGNYEFMGRVDHQVSLRGARLELGEIETLAAAVAGVTQAVAHVIDLGADEQTLVLYYTAIAGDAAPADGAERIRRHLARHLPDYMRPSLVQLVEAFPLNPNGKVDRKRLPRPDTGDVLVAPATETEQKLMEIWASLLGCDAVSVTANFFEVGGHSLMAAKLAAMIRAGFGIAFPLAQLFDAPTIRNCARCVENCLLDKYAQRLVDERAGRDPSQFDEILI